MTTQHPAGDGDTRPADRERLAQTLCLADDTMEHHEQTDDFPCSRCLHYADLFLAARAPAPSDAAQALRDALDEMLAVIADGDAAEVAASTPGEVGRSAVVARRDDLYNDPADWLSNYIDRLAAEPDASTRTVQVEVYVREPGPEVTNAVESSTREPWQWVRSEAPGLWCAPGDGSDPDAGWSWYALTEEWGPLVPVGTRDRLRAAADPGTRGEGDDRG